MNTMPTEAVLRWATGALGTGANVAVVKGRRLEPVAAARGRRRRADVVLRVADMGRIWPQAIATGAAALRVAEAHGLETPRLIASDLESQATGATATLETGSSASPPKERLREAGAALAKVHATPQHDLPLRLRPTDVDDHALWRRWATLYQATPDDGKPPSSIPFVS